MLVQRRDIGHVCGLLLALPSQLRLSVFARLFHSRLSAALPIADHVLPAPVVVSIKAHEARMLG